MEEEVVTPKKNYRSYIIIGFSFLIIICIFIALYIVKGPTFLSQLFVKTNRDSSSGFLPVPTGEIQDDTSLEYSNQPLMQDPPLPSIDDLDKLYIQARQAIESRDYGVFKRLASSDVTWNLEHESEIVGETKEGDLISKLTQISGEDVFLRLSLASIGYKAPPLEDIVPTSLDWYHREEEPEANSYYIDEATKQVTRVKPVQWRYEVLLQYNVKPLRDITGSGKVAFVYDRDHWAYALEEWSIIPPEKQRELGDISAGGVRIHKVSLIKTSGDCDPKVVTVKSGEAVKWENIKGRIYTIPPSPMQWQSEFLYADSFIKVLETPGEYTYLIVGPHIIDYKTPKCMIVVE